MNAPVAKDQFTFSLGNLSYVDSSYDDAPVYAPAQQKGGLRTWIGLGISAFVEWRRRQETLREMEMLSDHELADIGLTRADLPRVFDPAFAADRPRGMDYAG
jgi:uncharacterized protein YjiS (DUF1127 family)